MQSSLLHRRFPAGIQQRFELKLNKLWGRASPIFNTFGCCLRRGPTASIFVPSNRKSVSVLLCPLATNADSVTHRTHSIGSVGRRSGTTCNRPAVPSTTVTLASWAAKTSLSPLELNDTAWTHPPLPTAVPNSAMIAPKSIFLPQHVDFGLGSTSLM